MASTYSTNLRTELIGAGDQAGTWGNTTNTSLGSILEQAIAGVSGGPYVSGTYPTVNFPTDADLTLTANNGAVDQSRNAVLVVTSTGSLTATRNIIAPSSASKVYIIKNSTTGGQSIQIKYSSGTGVTIGNGLTALVYGDGTNFYLVTNPNSVTGNLTVSGNATVGGTLGVTGAQTNSSTLQATTITATTQFSGPGTGLTGTASSLNIGGNAATATTAPNPNALTITSPLTGTSYTGSTAVSIGIPAATTSVSGYLTSTDWNTFNGKQAAGSYVTVNGALGTPSSGTLTNCTFPTLNQNTIGSSGSCTGNSATATYATSAGNASTVTSISGNSLSSGQVTGALGFTPYNSTNPSGFITSSGSISGNAATATTATTANALNSGNSYNVASLTASGNITAYSDERLKKNWRPVQDDFVSKLSKVKSGIFERTDIEGTQVGISAQSLQPLMSEAIQTDKDGLLSVNYGAAAMVSCVELAKVVEELKAEIRLLKAK